MLTIRTERSPRRWRAGLCAVLLVWAARGQEPPALPETSPPVDAAGAAAEAEAAAAEAPPVEGAPATQETPPVEGAPAAEAEPALQEVNVFRKPRQVEVSVKVIEFQTTKGVETGLSAYFAKLPRNLPFGQVRTSGNAIETADLTFPTSTAAGLTVFLDRIFLDEGEIEVVLQALVDENRAFILSQPRAMVMIGEAVPTIVKTAQTVPYENTQVVGVVAQQVTAFRDTGVTLTVSAPEAIDDGGDWATRDDTWVRLHVRAEVKEEGQRIVVALDDQLAAGNFNQALNAIQVPEFISRSIETHVWLRDGQVLILGGLYRNTENRSLTTIPWLTQAEDVAVGAAQRLIPGNFLGSPISTTLGRRSSSEARRELVFILKCEVWDPSTTFATDLGFEDSEAGRRGPTGAITDILEEITEIPLGIVDNVTRDENSVGSKLGGLEN